MRAVRRRVCEILEAARPGDTTSARCDVFLITLISLNVLATVLESVPSIRAPLGGFFHGVEMLSVAIFSAEYLLRLWSCVESRDTRFRHPLFGRLRFAVTLMALIDLLAVLPFYAAAFVTIDLRFLRVLRILRIFKLSHYFSALDVLLDVVRIERYAFGASFFLLAVGTLFAASGIYLVEHEVQPVAFGSIPSAMWWALVTLTTVGYGDVTPITGLGKIFGASITVLGVGMVALPTGILASGFAEELRRRRHIYDGELRSALEDGVIDAGERVQLEKLRHELGLSEDDVEGLGSERRREAGASPSAPAEKCPHCGEALTAD